MHVSYMTSVKECQKADHACWDCTCHACPGRNQLKIENMSHWSFPNNRFLLMTQEMNPP